MREGERLTRRLGELSPETTTQIEALPIDQLEALGEALLDFTEINDLADWLNQNASLS